MQAAEIGTESLDRRTCGDRPAPPFLDMAEQPGAGHPGGTENRRQQHQAAESESVLHCFSVSLERRQLNGPRASTEGGS